jgi:hypothetical protein
MMPRTQDAGVDEGPPQGSGRKAGGHHGVPDAPTAFTAVVTAFGEGDHVGQPVRR